MANKLTFTLLIAAAVGATVWGFVSYNNLLQARTELTLLGIEMEALRTDLETTEDALGDTEEELTSAQEQLSSVQQELSSAEGTIGSLESKLELYEDTWGLVASGVQPPYQGADIVSSGTATNPTWAQLSAFLLSDKTDRKAYVPGVYMCGDFATDVHNNAERAGIRAAYVVVELPDVYHSLNAFKTTDTGLVFIDCTGLEASDPGPSNRDKTVNVKIGRSYVPRSIIPESEWSVTWENMGTVRDVQIYW